MRAIQINAWGGPEVLELVELPVPEPAADEVLIEVSRAGLNYADTHRRRNSYVARAELPLVPGAEVAGVRTDTGERVVALTSDGGYAEYATAPAALTFAIPEGVEDGQALALLLQGLTAYHVFVTTAKLAPGESVVVHSAAGGVGSLAVQLARPLGAGRVIATASTEQKRALALELGADAAVDGAADGLRDRLVEANLGEPLDVVIEMSGGRVFDESLAALARRYEDLMTGRFDAILDEWRHRAPGSRGARVRWETTSGFATGITAGVDESGALLVQTGDTVTRLVAGEVLWD